MAGRSARPLIGWSERPASDWLVEMLVEQLLFRGDSEMDMLCWFRVLSYTQQLNDFLIGSWLINAIELVAIVTALKSLAPSCFCCVFAPSVIIKVDSLN